MKKATFYIIAGDKKITDFMQAADAFDKSKIIATIQELTAQYKEDVDLTIEYAGRIIDNLRNKLEAEDQIVALIHIASIKIDNVTTENIGDISPYINKSVRMISDGKHWVMFHDILERLGIKVEYDENYYIL